MAYEESLSNVGEGSTSSQYYSHVACTFSESVGEYVYCDLTETSEMVYFGSEVDTGISTLEQLANDSYERQLFKSASRCTSESEKNVTKTMSAKLLDSTLFESEDGDVTTLTEGATASIVGGYHDHDAGEPFLHLEFVDSAGKTFRASSAYSRIVPILAK